MNQAKSDPLLLAGKVIAIFLQAAMAIGAVALIVAIPAVLLFSDSFAARAGMTQFAFPPGFPVTLLAGVMLIGLLIVTAMFVFFDRLRRIIGTVGEGDPFQPANADRLAAMAWLMLAVQLLFVPAAMLGHYIAQFADEMEDAANTVTSDLDLTGILLVIILFILARVFRHGAAMREDLEGTV